MGRKKKPDGFAVTGESGVTVKTDSIDGNDRVDRSDGRAKPADLAAKIRPVEGVEMWPREWLVPHPDNPRTVNVRSPKFIDLVESIKNNLDNGTNGVIEPLTVRNHHDDKTAWREGLGIRFREVLSGARRFTAAGIAGVDAVPVRNLGDISDETAYDVVALGNIHEELTPLENGKRIATWLDKYGQRVDVVAEKLGITKHMVLSLAMIERNLIIEWKDAIRSDAEEAAQDGDWGRFSRWTAEHWRHIARLPAAIQEYWLNKIEKDYRFNPGNATADTVAEWLETEKLFLAKATFDSGKECGKCPKRTDAISELLWQDEGVTADEGAAVRCLDPTCWQRKREKKVRNDFKDRAAEAQEDYAAKHGLGMPHSAVPISMVERAKGRHYDDAYEDKMKPLRKAFKDLVEADRVTVVKEGTKGAVPGIVVAGDKWYKKGSVVWVKVKAKPERSAGQSYAPKPKTAAEIAKEKEEAAQRDRRAAVVRSVATEILKVKSPTKSLEEQLYICTVCQRWPGGYDERKEIKAAKKAWGEGETAFRAAMADAMWLAIRGEMKQWTAWAAGNIESWERCLVVGPLFGVQPGAMLQKLVDKDKKGKDLSDAIDPVDGKDGECIGDCQTCGLDTCAKTGCAVDQGPHKGLKSKKPAKKKPVRAKHLSPAGQDHAPRIEGAVEDVAGDVSAGGVIATPEIVSVPLPKETKATVQIKLGRAKGQWFGGCSAHVPGGGLDHPCSVHQGPYATRTEALDAVAAKVMDWLDGKPGRQTYKHWETIWQAVFALLSKPGEKLGRDRSGPPAVTTRRTLAVKFPASYKAKCEITLLRIDGQWQFGFSLQVGKEQVTLDHRGGEWARATKAACLQSAAISMAQWLDSRKLLIRNRDRIQVQARIEEVIEEELAKRACRICGCTEDDCRSCIERTGNPCTWVGPDLCSACEDVR